METTNPIPSWFKVTVITAIVWNILGVLAFVGHVMMTPEAIATLPAAEQKLYQDTPVWATIAFAIAVFAGLLGSISLLLKKAICLPLLIASLVGIIVQDINSFLLSNTLEVYGAAVITMPIFVLIIALLLIALANKGKANNWFS